MGLALLVSFLFLVSVKTCLDGRDHTPSVLQDKDSLLWRTRFIAVWMLLLSVRIVLSLCTSGYISDISCWLSWGNRLDTVGASAFYTNDSFCDYPPGYLYILGLIAKIGRVLSVSDQGTVFLAKCPPILCDMLLSILIYRQTYCRFSAKSAFLCATLFLCTPIFAFDSSVWGQIESVLLLFLLLSMYDLLQKRYYRGIFWYAIAVLIKPQALLLAPIVLIVLIDTKSIKTILLSVLIALLTAYLISLPFSDSLKSAGGFSAWIHSFDLTWLIKKYITTLASYPYFTVNAYNFYGLLGLNWVSLPSSFGFTLLQTGILAAAVIGTVILYVKIEDRGSKFRISAYFMLAFLYTFSFKMHERYLYLPTLFLLIEYIHSKNKHILVLFLGFATVGFLNIYDIYRLAATTQGVPSYLLVMPLSLAEVTLFLFSLFVIARDYLHICQDTPNVKKVPRICFSKACTRICEMLNLTAVGSTQRMVRADYLLLSVIVILYSMVAFFRLGDLHAPQTFYQPIERGDTFTITLQDTKTITEIDFFCGIGDVEASPGLRFSYSEDGVNWKELPHTVCVLTDVYQWKTDPLPNIYAKYLRGTAESSNYRLLELGLRCFDESLAEIADISGINSADYAAMIDEQDTVTDQPSYLNGTYFDEIYHPRTAYEHLHGLPYYETTHPPLGKLIMSLGIAVFGMTPFGWRFAGTLIGVFMLPIFYLFLKQLFQRTRYAFLGTLLFAFDFMHFSLTRLATIDSYPVFFILCMYYFMYRFCVRVIDYAKGENMPYRKFLIPLALSGISMGLGCASKWITAYGAVGLCLVYFITLAYIAHQWQRRDRAKPYGFLFMLCAFCMVFFVALPFMIYLLSYLPIARVDGYGNVFEAMINNQLYMFRYHTELSGSHPYASPWYTWPFVYKPMWAYQAPTAGLSDNQIGCISIFQNPLLSWMGIAAFFYSIHIGLKKRDRKVLFLTIALLSEFLPWAFVNRYALQYHFFATLPFLILFVIYAMKDIEEKNPRFSHLSDTLTALCLIMFCFFYPVLIGLPISRFYVQTFLTWFSSWVFFI